MNTLHGLRALTIAGLGGLSAAGALAQAEGGYTYGGLSFGRATTSFDERAIAGSLLGAGTSVTSLSSDTRGNAFKLFGGYQINRNMAVEAGYFNLGKFGFSADTTPAGTLDGRMRIQGANLDLVGLLPLTTNLSAPVARSTRAHARASTPPVRHCRRPARARKAIPTRSGAWACSTRSALRCCCVPRSSACARPTASAGTAM